MFLVTHALSACLLGFVSEFVVAFVEFRRTGNYAAEIGSAVLAAWRPLQVNLARPFLLTDSSTTILFRHFSHPHFRFRRPLTTDKFRTFLLTLSIEFCALVPPWQQLS
jgi:hypothetical protein